MSHVYHVLNKTTNSIGFMFCKTKHNENVNNNKNESNNSYKMFDKQFNYQNGQCPV